MTIEDLIKEQIEKLDIKSLVMSEIRRLVSDDVKRSIAKTTDDEIQKIIKTEIEICLQKPVQTDDGWGQNKTYTSFEEMFKIHFKGALDKSYDIKRTIENHVKQECDKLVKQNTTQIVDALKKQLTEQPK